MPIERYGCFIDGVDDHSKDSERPSGRNHAPQRIGNEEAADSSLGHAYIARQASDERSGNRVVAGQFAGDILRQVQDIDREAAEAVEPDYPESGIDRDVNACDVSSLILTGAQPKPLVEAGFSTREGSTIVPFPQRLYDDGRLDRQPNNSR